MEKITRFNFNIDLPIEKIVIRIRNQTNRRNQVGLDFVPGLSNGNSVSTLIGPYPFSGTFHGDTYKLNSLRLDYWSSVKIKVRENEKATRVEIFISRYWLTLFMPMLFIMIGTVGGLYHFSNSDYDNGEVLGVFALIGLVSTMFFHWQISRTVRYFKNAIINAR